MKVQLTRNNIIERNVGAVLARCLITRPASTFIMNIEKYGVLIVDRAAVPVEGSVMLMATEKGFSLQRATKRAFPRRTCGAW